MARILLSTLGTGRYLEGSYILRGSASSCTPFIQEALAEILCKSWGPEDRITVFCTGESEKKNWVDGSNFERGLESRLKGLPIQASVRRVLIPEGRSEDEIMGIFNAVYAELNHGDEVVLDITHSFRSLPLLNTVILNYAKVLKKIRVSAILYGAFESLGPLKEIEKLPSECRRAPVFDLTPYDTLLDWSVAVDDFVRHGWTERLQELVAGKVVPILRATQGGDETLRELNKLANRLHGMALNILTARCPEIERFSSLTEVVERIKGQQVIPPLNPLLDLLLSKTRPFDTVHPEEKGFEAVEWCIAHNLVPQGYTILRETLISGMCRLLGKNPCVREEREDFIGSLLNVLARNKPESDWQGGLANRKEEARAVIRTLGKPLQDLAEAFHEIGRRRNNINHCGCAQGERVSADELITELGEKLSRARAAWAGIVESTQTGKMSVLGDENLPRQKKEGVENPSEGGLIKHASLEVPGQKRA